MANSTFSCNSPSQKYILSIGKIFTQATSLFLRRLLEIFLASREAKKISSNLLKKRLVACVNIFPIESMYFWDGELQENVEFAILAKTRDENYSKVENAVKEMH